MSADIIFGKRSNLFASSSLFYETSLKNIALCAKKRVLETETCK